MRHFNTISGIAVFALLFISIGDAQQTPITAVPNLIRYSGTLKDANGAPTAATTGVTFSIYKQQDGGAPVWMETQNITPDASGQYSVLLGSTTTTGLPSDLFSQEEQRWLGVQVQGQAEQPRVLLVSVPYAFKAHEAETLAGKSVSDFVLAKDANGTNPVAGIASSSGSGSTQAAGYGNNKSPSNLALSQGPTNFSGSTTDQIVKVTQSGTGLGILAATTSATNSDAVVGTITGPGVAIFGQAYSTSAMAYGVEGMTASNIGIGLLGFATATTGSTYGLKGYSSSTGGTGVRGLSTATTGFTTGISASVASPAGTAGVFNNVAGGKILSGQNNGAEKFSVDGSGNVNSASGSYEIGGSGVVNIGSVTDNNLFVGVGAGAHNIAGFGLYNVFSGYQAGFSNTTGSANTFSGSEAGFSNTTGVGNTFYGSYAGYSNTTGYDNTFSGITAGQGNTSGGDNAFYGYGAGAENTTGGDNAFYGNNAGLRNTTGSSNSFYGNEAGIDNTTGSSNTFYGNGAGLNNTAGSSDIYIGNQGPTSGTEGNTIRIGTQGTGAGQQNVTYIAGVYGGTTNGGSAVFVDSTGRLGTGGGGGGLVLTSVIQNYTSSTDISCPNGYTAVLASCQSGVNVVLNDVNSPLPPGASSWADYLTPSVNNATGVHCDVGIGNQSQAQLRCAQL